MLKIRLKRTGRKGQPHYRVVVMESTRARDSKAIEDLGYYNPRTQPSTFDVDKEAVQKWLQNGAQPTDTVAQLLVKEGVLKGLKKGSKLAQPKKKKKEASE
jgi:small subunit ribosomal protein S16